VKKTLLMIRGWIGHLPFLRHLIPQTGDRDNTEMFDVAGCKIDRVASVTAIGITGALPGGRATLIIPDDVEQPENTITRQQRERLRERVTEFEAILSPGGDIVYLGTPHHEETLYDALERPASDRLYRPYRFRTWPIQYPTAEETTASLAPMLYNDLKTGKAQPGDPVWPERFSKDYMLSLVMGRTRWLMQYMLVHNLSKSHRFPLKLADLIVHPVNPLVAPVTIQYGKTNSRGSTAIEDIPSPGFADDMFYGPCMIADKWVPYQGCKAFLDPAGSGEDEMAWAIVGQLHGYLYAKDAQAVKGGPTEQNLDKIILSLRANHCHELHVETNFGGEALISLLQNTVARHALPPDTKNEEFPTGWAAAILPLRSSGQKEVRIIDSLEPVLNMHRLVIDPQVAQNQELMYQLVHITREREALEHDDRIEALAGAVNLFADALNQIPERQAARLAEQERADRLERYYRDFGLTPPAKTWSGLQPVHS